MKKKVPFKTEITNVLFLIDASASMSRHYNSGAVRRTIQENLARLKEEAKNRKQEYRLSVWFFHSKAWRVISDAPLETVTEVTIPGLDSLGGYTRLWGSLAEATVALEENSSVRDSYAENVFLCWVLTDGQNNMNPSRYNAGGVSPAAANWTFVGTGPAGSRAAFLQEGFEPGNISEWDIISPEGLLDLSAKTVQSMGTYASARSAGLKKSSSFYTDASAVTEKDLSKLCQIGATVYSVPAEDKIRPFVEKKTRQPYVLGSAYYLLQKKERIQPQKTLLLQHKKTKKIYADSGGLSVRDLLGIRSTGEIRVEPGNHADYDIFVESNSVNRILPRGTKVLVV